MKTLLLTEASDAAKLLKQGEVVALPTETVYGLAGNATDARVVNKIFIAKERPYFDPLIVHISDSYLKEERPLDLLAKENILDSSVLGWKNREKIELSMRRFWPGPLTLILPKGNKIPLEVTSGQNTVGIRCPEHSQFQKVLHALSFPLAAPSANRFGRISPTSAEHVLKELDGKIAGILDGGNCAVGVESTIIRITEDDVTLLRPGKISKTEIESIFGPLQIISEPILAPGMLDEHYSPRKPLYLIPLSFENPQTQVLLDQFPQSQELTAAFLSMSGFHSSFQHRAEQVIRILSPQKSEEEMAKNLFSTLRELDENEKVSVIFADSPSSTQEGLGASIFDRLKRASRNKPSFPL